MSKQYTIGMQEEAMGFAWTAEQGRVRVALQCLLQDRDGMAWIYGGDRPHLGAVAVRARDAAPQIMVLPGREEGAVAEEAVRRLADTEKLDRFTLG